MRPRTRPAVSGFCVQIGSTALMTSATSPARTGKDPNTGKTNAFSVCGHCLAGDLTERLHEKGIGGPPGRKCLLVPLAALIEVVGDPPGPDLTAGLPRAFADGCHQTTLLGRPGPRRAGLGLSAGHSCSVICLRRGSTL